MGLFVKICGLASAADVDAVAALKPDAMGFVFWPGSKRCVTVEEAARWAGAIPPDILKVGVFVDAPARDVAMTMQAAALDVAQLHGHEPPELAADIPGRSWKAVHLDRLDTRLLAAYHVDAFLADSYSADSPGGTGRVGDWERVRAFVASQTTPVILAGGLTPENVEAAVRTVKPWGVDTSSGVEVRPGRKDLAKVRDFIERCRNL